MQLALWGLVAAVPAVSAEYLYRVLPGPWSRYLWLWVPIGLTVSYAIYRLVTTPKTSLIGAFVVWAFSTTIIRVFLSVVILRDTIDSGTWAALGLVVAARVVQLVWH